MTSAGIKPRLVFFQHKNDETLPEFLLLHRQAHVRCLSNFFEVIVVNTDGDYGEICDRLRPDLTLFELGLNQLTCVKPRISNVRSRPAIPKAALHNADAWCDARAGFLSDVEELGIETFFAISVTAGEHTPEMADNLFVWPNCIEPALFHDYGEAKRIPLLFTGAMTALYPWRTKIQRIVSAQYPSLICPHTGYDPRKSPGQMLFGEKYARTINASQIVPTCGTVAGEVVRKHFEIPAARACLVTERTPALEAAGFVDMENCVFADESNVLAKLDHLFRNPQVLEQITEAGFNFVQTRHTDKQRDQIYQWFRLQAELKPGERIVQRNPFGPMAVVEAGSREKTVHIHSNGAHLALMRQGDEKLSRRKLDEAESLYLRCLNHVQWMPEPKLRIARLQLFQGRPAPAFSTLAGLNEYVLLKYGAARPDPVEWAWLILACLCLGETGKGFDCAARFPALRHPETDRARWVAIALNGGPAGRLAHPPEGTKYSRTLHQLPPLDFGEWTRQTVEILNACGQIDAARKITEQAKGEPRDFSAFMDFASDKAGANATPPDWLSRASARAPASAGLSGRQVSRSPMIRKLGAILQGLEGKFGYFLPYRVSSMRNDEFFAAVRNIAEKEEIRNALILGASAGCGVTEAFLAGCARSRTVPKVFCLSATPRQANALQERKPGVCRPFPPPNASLAAFARAFLEEHSARKFEAIVVDLSEWNRRGEFDADFLHLLGSARVVIVDDLNTEQGLQIRRALTEKGTFVVTVENPELRNGYAILHKAGGMTES